MLIQRGREQTTVGYTVTVWRLRVRAHWGLVRVFGRSRLNDASTQTAPAQWGKIHSEVAFYVYEY